MSDSSQEERGGIKTVTAFPTHVFVKDTTSQSFDVVQEDTEIRAEDGDKETIATCSTNEERPTWHRHWMSAAHLAKEMCTCKRRAVGAVFVRDNRQLVSGFNGVPTKFPHPTICKRTELGLGTNVGLDLCPCAHAEANAVANAAKNGVSLDGATVYVTSYPCHNCMGQMANAGISAVYYEREYPSELTAEIARHAGIRLTQYVE